MSVRGTIPLETVRWETVRRVNALGQLSVGEKPAGKMSVGELSGYHLFQCSLSLKERVNITSQNSNFITISSFFVFLNT